MRRLCGVVALVLGLVLVASGAASGVASGAASASAAAAGSTVWRSVSVGGNVTCAIDTSSHLWCWGYDQFGQLGDGDSDGASKAGPVRVDDAEWLSVQTAFQTTCGIRLDHTAYCWGDNQFGQVGVGTSGGGPVLRPEPVSSSATFRTVSPGPTNTCGISTSDRLYCWGTRVYGGVGDGTSGSTVQTVPLRIGSETWRSISVGAFVACGLTTAQQAECWGSNSHGSLGTGDGADRNAPTVAGTPGNRWTKLSVHDFTTCAITSRGVTMCWGANDRGQIGDGTTDDAYSPTALRRGSTAFVNVKTGYHYSCGLTSAVLVRCWGNNGSFHEFGNGSETSSPGPTDAAGGRVGWKAVAVGDYHSCGLRPSGRLLCWGDDTDGQLGNGSFDPTSVPVVVGS